MYERERERGGGSGLWQVLRSFNIEEGLAKVIQVLYENSSSTLLLNSQLREFFKTTVGVRHICLVSPILRILFNRSLRNSGRKRSMTTTHPSLFVEGPYAALRFADDNDLMGDSNGKLQDLADCLVERATAYGKKVII